MNNFINAAVLINEMENYEENQMNVNSRVFNNRNNAFDLPDTKFKKIFRLSKEITNNFIEIVRPYMPEERRISALNPTVKICDANMKIININSRYPGNTHDVYIWNNSNISTLMEQIHRRVQSSFYLLGDSAYPLRPWLLTPINNAEPNTPEALYNERQARCRSLIERVNGLLKMRFRCLLKHRVLHYTPEKASKIINTCAVLHNMCILNEEPHPEPEEGDEILDYGIYNNEIIQQIEHGVNRELAAGRLLQRRIIENYFR